MAFIFMQSEPPRRQIVKDGITYREVRSEDDYPMWRVAIHLFIAVFVGMPILFIVVAWFLMPVMDWVIKHGPQP